MSRVCKSKGIVRRKKYQIQNIQAHRYKTHHRDETKKKQLNGKALSFDPDFAWYTSRYEKTNIWHLTGITNSLRVRDGMCTPYAAEN